MRRTGENLLPLHLDQRLVGPRRQRRGREVPAGHLADQAADNGMDSDPRRQAGTDEAAADLVVDSTCQRIRSQAQRRFSDVVDEFAATGDSLERRTDRQARAHLGDERRIGDVTTHPGADTSNDIVLEAFAGGDVLEYRSQVTAVVDGADRCAAGGGGGHRGQRHVRPARRGCRSCRGRRWPRRQSTRWR